MKKTLSYKGYEGSVECSIEDNVLHGKILFIRDLIAYEADAICELKQAFEDAVDDYLQDCAEEGKDPDKPFSGTFNVRLGQERHKNLARLAARRGENLNQTLCVAVDSLIKHDGKPKSITHVHVELDKQVDITPTVSNWKSESKVPKVSH